MKKRVRSVIDAAAKLIALVENPSDVLSAVSKEKPKAKPKEKAKVDLSKLAKELGERRAEAQKSPQNKASVPEGDEE